MDKSPPAVVICSAFVPLKLPELSAFAGTQISATPSLVCESSSSKVALRFSAEENAEGGRTNGLSVGTVLADNGGLEAAAGVGSAEWLLSNDESLLA